MVALIQQIRGYFNGFMSDGSLPVVGVDSTIADRLTPLPSADLVAAISAATNSQTDNERKIARELMLLREGRSRRLLIERFKLHHPARANQSGENFIRWFINIVRKYCDILSILYVVEPERYFVRVSDDGTEMRLERSNAADRAILSNCESLLKSTRWTANWQEIEQLSNLHQTVFGQPYLKARKGEVGLRLIARHETGVDMDPDDPEDIDSANLVWVVGAVDADDNPLWYECWTQERFFYLDVDSEGHPGKPMSVDPVMGVPYPTVSPYVEWDRDGYVIPFMPFFVIRDAEPYRNLYRPVPEQLHDLQLNLDSMATSTCHSILWGMFSVATFTGFEREELPTAVGPETMVVTENENARFELLSGNSVFRDGIEAIKNLLKFSLVMTNFPPNLVTTDVHERTGDAILASRLDVETVRVRQKPRYTRAEPDAWKKVMKVHNHYCRTGQIKGGLQRLIPDDIELRVMHKIFQPSMNPQSEAQAQSMRIQSGMTTPASELAEKYGITLEDAQRLIDK